MQSKVGLEITKKNNLRFILTGNPLLAWKTYQQARNFSVPVPEEVLIYLDAVAAGIIRIAHKPPKPKDTSAELAKALGMVKKSVGPGSYFSELSKSDRDLKVSQDVQSKIREYKADVGSSRGAKDWAYTVVAEKYKISSSTARRLHKKYQADIDLTIHFLSEFPEFS